ncbi:ABC transporter ATP-binding protein [Parapedobacter koreensis]|uniref:ATP-binding cassette, subfamily B, MsbA n=1 Tax=Parapedobacter koreensis TaxID=332977 RepID=A0A1H7NPR7_9SPHI|nr:ABC transporter ATP-binding protein [Parapedobacter koreensis]SEL25411.1 ATP-binding cassette, subfamily B, MsbA [Parapedobacter koreensis]
MLKNLIKKYFQNFHFFYSYLRNRIFYKVALSITVGLLDGFGLAMFLPLLQMVDDSTKADPNALGNLDFILRGMNHLGIELTLGAVLLLICLFFILKGFALYVNSRYDVSLKQFFIKSIRKKLTFNLSAIPYKSFIQMDAGRIQNVLSGEVVKITQAYEQYFAIIQHLVLVIVYMSFAFLLDSKFAILITIGGLLTNILFKVLFGKTKKASIKLTKGTNIYQGLIIQYVAHFKYLKVSGNIEVFNKMMLNTIEFIERHNKQLGTYGAIILGGREPILIIVVSAVILTQVQFLGGTLATILVSLLFFYRALTALMSMQAAHNNFLAVSGSMENITGFIKELSNHKQTIGPEKLHDCIDSIELDSVSFSYKENPVIDNVSLGINKNETVAFVGESGGGKSTIINLLTGLLAPESGSMFINGINRNQIDITSYQKKIGYITQEPVIFNDTIFNNVTFWSEKSDEVMAKYETALKMASILDFVEELSLKGETMLGNNGVNLSGGQKQRISIARELFKEVDVLVLDEATSALDSYTEKVIQQNIEQLKGKYTILIVAHRLATVKHADKIVLMSRGKVVDIGDYDSLAESSSEFSRFVQLQKL